MRVGTFLLYSHRVGHLLGRPRDEIASPSDRGMRAPTQLLLLGALVSAGHAAALMVGGRIGWSATPLRTRAIPSTLLMSGGDDDSDTTPDDLDAFRAQLMRQFETADASAGTDAMDTSSSTPAAPSAPRVGDATAPPRLCHRAVLRIGNRVRPRGRCARPRRPLPGCSSSRIRRASAHVIPSLDR